MKCEEAGRLLSLCLDNELEQPRCEEMTRHLQQCAACEWELATLARTVRLMQAVTSLEPPRDYWNTFKDSLKATTKE